MKITFHYIMNILRGFILVPIFMNKIITMKLSLKIPMA